MLKNQREVKAFGFRRKKRMCMCVVCVRVGGLWVCVCVLAEFHFLRTITKSWSVQCHYKRKWQRFWGGCQWNHWRVETNKDLGWLLGSHIARFLLGAEAWQEKQGVRRGQGSSDWNKECVMFLAQFTVVMEPYFRVCVCFFLMEK